MQSKLTTSQLPDNVGKMIQLEIVNRVGYLPGNIRLKIAEELHVLAELYSESTFWAKFSNNNVIPDLSELLNQTSGLLHEHASNCARNN
ncbi:MAG TPA: hypothetical protein VL442_03035 [Mucilaginibacter sp.]|jgi:hypothetical protein|nr:hypothetical protein [Mucilaginibacter sp.]